MEVKDANEESSSTDDKEVESEAEPEADPEADPEAELEAEPVAEFKTENAQTKEGASTPEVLEPVIIVEDKKDEVTTNL